MGDDLFSIPKPKREEQVEARGGLQEEVSDCYGPAHARRSDPGTSHRAAREVTPHTDNIRADVEKWARSRGAEGVIDEELSAAFDATDSSSYRTRRGELTAAGKIVDTGRRRANSNARQCIVWKHAQFAHDYTPEPKPLSIREQLLAHARRLNEDAEWCRKQGWVGLAAHQAETAALIQTALDVSAAREKSDKAT